MPITHRAIKKLSHDRARADQNALVRKNIKKVITQFRATPTPKNLTTVFKVLDKATKHGVVHPNKSSRLKSRLSKLLKKK